METKMILYLLFRVLLTSAKGHNIPDLDYVQERAPSTITTVDAPLVHEGDNSQHFSVQSIFPGIHFNCSGSITEWTVIASYENRMHLMSITPYVLLELWRSLDGTNYTVVNPGGSSPLKSVLPTSTTPSLFTQHVDPPLHFEAGDVLGVYNPYRGDTQTLLRYLSSGGPLNYAVGDIGDQKKTPQLVLNVERNIRTSHGAHNYPLVAVRASPSICAEGFLSKDALRTVIQKLSLTSNTGPAPESMCYAQMHFTCSGSINKILFAGKQTTPLSTTQWPQLQLYSCDIVGNDLSCDPVPKATIPLNNTQKTNSFDTVYEQTFDPPVEFDANDRIGLYQPAQGASQVEVYFKEGALLESFDTSYNNSINCVNTTTDIPFMAIKADVQECVGSGFITENQLSQSVNMLFNIESILDQQRIIPDMNFTVNGNITKWNFASRVLFPTTNKIGYPELQVWRVSAFDPDEFTLVHSTSGLTPRLTNDANLYEYVLDEPWPVMAGDFIGMYVPDREKAKMSLYSSDGPDGPLNYYFLNAKTAHQTFNFGHSPLMLRSIPIVSIEFITGDLFMNVSVPPATIAEKSDNLLPFIVSLVLVSLLALTLAVAVAVLTVFLCLLAPSKQKNSSSNDAGVMLDLAKRKSGGGESQELHYNSAYISASTRTEGPIYDSIIEEDAQ